MRREGRQHGIVRTYRILPPPPLNPRLVNSATSPSTSALFTKLPSKPTRAHRRIWYGQVHWLRSNDMASSSSYKLLTCRIITGPRSVLNLTGLSDLNGGSGDDFLRCGMMMEHVLDHDDDEEEEEDGWCLV
ncbi:hypothetical protein Bca52824_095397 [Brassica carinata]|uniref:Uncharacterized protein n=1 Tax=Brassica carinata TaxID=52824 RepID=A0A8X7P0B6_BRACI|nr:hypothetical protein Bca52824_095397 [Brassica carinata]